MRDLLLLFQGMNGKSFGRDLHVYTMGKTALLYDMFYDHVILRSYLRRDALDAFFGRFRRPNPRGAFRSNCCVSCRQSLPSTRKTERVQPYLAM